jgi:hypothetical protein
VLGNREIVRIHSEPEGNEFWRAVSIQVHLKLQSITEVVNTFSEKIALDESELGSHGFPIMVQVPTVKIPEICDEMLPEHFLPVLNACVFAEEQLSTFFEFLAECEYPSKLIVRLGCGHSEIYPDHRLVCVELPLGGLIVKADSEIKLFERAGYLRVFTRLRTEPIPEHHDYEVGRTKFLIDELLRPPERRNDAFPPDRLQVKPETVRTEVINGFKDFREPRSLGN